MKTKPIPIADVNVARFWSRVKKLPGKDACWVWTGKLFRAGYGRFYIKAGEFIAHRVSFALTGNDIPGDLNVLHTCDNRRCVRPKHLFLGTHLDNMQDMVRKGRAGLPPPYRVTQDLGLIKR